MFFSRAATRRICSDSWSRQSASLNITVPTRKCRLAAIPLALVALVHAVPGNCAEDYLSLRKTMVRQQIVARGIRDTHVVKAMREVPRHLFVPKSYVSKAYGDHPVPIGLGQTISQPYIVALMTELLELEGSHKVFELGTGSGYQAAVASRIAMEVYTVEIYDQLADAAAERLGDLGYSNIHVLSGDGYLGWEEKGPFDAIIVTAAADHIPPPLLKQLKPGGRLVIPLGNPFFVQQLVLVIKDMKGRIKEEPVIPVRFVPLLGH